MLAQERVKEKLRTSDVVARFWNDIQRLIDNHRLGSNIAAHKVQHQAAILARKLEVRYEKEPFNDAVPVFPGAHNYSLHGIHHFILDAGGHEQTPTSTLYVLIDPEDGRRVAGLRPYSRRHIRAGKSLFDRYITQEPSAENALRAEGRRPFNLDQCMCYAICRPKALDDDYRMDATASRMRDEAQNLEFVPYVQMPRLETVDPDGRPFSIPLRPVHSFEGRVSVPYPNHGTPSYSTLVRIDREKNCAPQTTI